MELKDHEELFIIYLQILAVIPNRRGDIELLLHKYGDKINL